MSSLSQHLPRLLPLAASLGLVFGLTTHTHTASAATLLVTDCTDGAGSGTLRHTIAAAANNDTVLIQPATCSKITVSGSQIVPPAAATNLTISGPGADQLTISGGYDLAPHQYHRIFATAATGTLTISGVTLTESKYQGSGFPIGGCVYSAGSVLIQNSVVTDCFLNPPTTATTDTRGDAIYAKKNVTVVGSTISNNLATSVGTGKKVAGSGIYAGTGLAVVTSTISGNGTLAASSSGGGAYVKTGYLLMVESNVSSNSATRGGGLFQATGGTGAKISYSTINNNTGTDNGGFELHAVDNTKIAKIINSTISGNVVTGFQGGGGTYFPTRVYNSTIAFNRAATATFAVGLYSSQAITMQSSIFANNTGKGAYDVGSHATGVLSGSDNLITATPDAVPLGTIQGCPKLGPLTNNGGITLTHSLLNGSPAIDQGNTLVSGGLSLDQRLQPRAVGTVDMGAYERQASETAAGDDRIFLAEFESACL